MEPFCPFVYSGNHNSEISYRYWLILFQKTSSWNHTVSDNKFGRTLKRPWHHKKIFVTPVILCTDFKFLNYLLQLFHPPPHLSILLKICRYTLYANMLPLKFYEGIFSFECARPEKGLKSWPLSKMSKPKSSFLNIFQKFCQK